MRVATFQTRTSWTTNAITSAPREQGTQPFHVGGLDTPTLLSSKFSAPYFHNGSLPTLRAVNEWFNRQFGLGLSRKSIDDLTAYVEAVGDGVQGIEDKIYTLDSELEEFKFFLSTYERLKQRKKERIDSPSC